jgi:hypothetical protein
MDFATVASQTDLELKAFPSKENQCYSETDQWSKSLTFLLLYSFIGEQS